MKEEEASAEATQGQAAMLPTLAQAA